jgi:hypothetical protein
VLLKVMLTVAGRWLDGLPDHVLSRGPAAAQPRGGPLPMPRPVIPSPPTTHAGWRQCRHCPPARPSRHRPRCEPPAATVRSCSSWPRPLHRVRPPPHPHRCLRSARPDRSRCRGPRSRANPPADGDYESLSAVLVLEQAGRSSEDIVGLIFSGDFPPLAEAPAAE